MARHKSAEKRARQTPKRTERNIAIKTRVKSVIRAYREAAATGDKASAEQALAVATREIRKAASKGIMKKTTSSRRVSRLVLSFNAIA